MRATPAFVLWVVSSGLAQGVIWYRGHIYVDIGKTWMKANDYCRQKNSNLSTITTAEENTILHNAMERHAALCSWIGLVQIENLDTEVSQDWYWVDGDASGYRKWAPGEPNTNVEHCAEMQYDGMWNNRNCDWICTFFCYKWQRKVVLVPERMSWEEALLHCRKEHADLASLLTDHEAAVADAMANETRTTLVWTSLRFLAGEWLWVSESNQTDQVFTQGSLPSCPVQNHSCGARRPMDGQWENRDCQEKLHFFCYRA